MIRGYPRPQLRLIQGGLNCSTSVGAVEVVAAPDGRLPFKVEGFVFEEDTALMLSTSGKDVKACREQMLKSQARGTAIDSHAPGSVVVRGRYPYRFFAVVHDLDCDPTWRVRWVKAAIDSLLMEVDRLELRAIALPLLGTVHGQMDPERFLVMLHQALIEGPPRLLRRLWLVAPSENCGGIIKILEATRGRAFW